MTTVMMIGLFIALVLLLIGFGFEMATVHPNAGAKAMEWLATALAVAAGFLIGAIVVPGDWHDWIHGEPPRGVNVAGVKFAENAITFPPPTEIGARWVLVTSETGTKGTFVTNDVMNVPTGDKTVKIYMTFPDKRSTPAVEIGKDGTIVASAGS